MMWEWIMGERGEGLLRFNEERERTIQALKRIEALAAEQRALLVEMQREEGHLASD